MGRALYRKYRSKSLSEIVGQEHVTTALGNSLKNGTIGHAYLFTGPRGVGKTSIARILAHEVNDLPYEEDATHLDIIEIDAASNRRIDEIRALRERVHNAPTSAKYKVYIIDEVHMLTKEAFNALLKTLEEPPQHVIFILATTEVHKLPETIISRTQRFSFKPADQETAVEHLKEIAKQEKINVTDEALALIAEQGGGSFRDSISILDQVRNASDKIESEHVQKLLGIAPKTAIQRLIQALATKELAILIEQLQNLRAQGFQAAHIAKQLGTTLREQVLAQSNVLPPSQAITMVGDLINVPRSHDPFTQLELILVAATLPTETSHAAQPSKPAQNMPAKTVIQPVTKQDNVTAKEPHEQGRSITPENETGVEPLPTPNPKSEIATETNPSPGQPSDIDESAWQRILLALKQQHNTLYGIARMAVPLFDGDNMTLTFSFPFHQKRFNETKTKQILGEIITTETGRSVTITCVVDSTKSNKNTAAKPSRSTSATPLDTISNIFGGAEVIE